MIISKISDIPNIGSIYIGHINSDSIKFCPIFIDSQTGKKITNMILYDQKDKLDINDILLEYEIRNTNGYATELNLVFNKSDKVIKLYIKDEIIPFILERIRDNKINTVLN